MATSFSKFVHAKRAALSALVLGASVACASHTGEVATTSQALGGPVDGSCTYEVFDDSSGSAQSVNYFGTMLPGFTVVRAGVSDWTFDSPGLWQFTIADTAAYVSSVVPQSGENTEFSADYDYSDAYIDTPKPDAACAQCPPDLEDHDGWMAGGPDGTGPRSLHVLADPPQNGPKPAPVILRPPAAVTRPGLKGLQRGLIVLDNYVAHIESSTQDVVAGRVAPKIFIAGGGVHGADIALWLADGLQAPGEAVGIHTGAEGPVWIQMGGGPGGQRRFPRLGLKGPGDPNHVPEHEVDFYNRDGESDFWDKGQVGEVVAAISSSFPTTRLRVVQIKPRKAGDFEVVMELANGTTKSFVLNGGGLARGIGDPRRLTARRFTGAPGGQIDLVNLPDGVTPDAAEKLVSDHVLVTEQVQVLASTLNRLGAALKARGVEPQDNVEYKRLYDQARRLVAGKKVLFYGAGPNLVWSLEDLYFGNEGASDLGTLVGKQASGFWVVSRKSDWGRDMDPSNPAALFARDGAPDAASINGRPGRMSATLKKLEQAINGTDIQQKLVPDDWDIKDVKLVKLPRGAIRYRVTFGNGTDSVTEEFDTLVTSMGYDQSFALYSSTGGMGAIPKGKARFQLVLQDVDEGGKAVKRVVGLQAQVFDGDTGKVVPIFVGGAEAFILAGKVRAAYYGRDGKPLGTPKQEAELLSRDDLDRFALDFDAKNPRSRVGWIGSFNKDAAGGFTFEYWVPLDQALAAYIAKAYPGLAK